MSGGTPVAGGFMRQRHSQGGYASSGDDLEDDACSRLRQTFEPSPRIWSRVEILENVLWLVSAVFVVYFGDRHSNLIYLLCYDDRIRSYSIWFLGSTLSGCLLNYMWKEVNIEDEGDVFQLVFAMAFHSFYFPQGEKASCQTLPRIILLTTVRQKFTAPAMTPC